MRETFDEALPAYSLGEDYDLWVRVKRYGLTGRYDRCVAVHLRASGGRLSARKMAYAHIANHWHFIRKGVSSLPYPWSYARFIALCIKLPLLSLIECAGDDQGKNSRAIHKQFAIFSKDAHAPRGFLIFRINRLFVVGKSDQS